MALCSFIEDSVHYANKFIRSIKIIAKYLNCRNVKILAHKT